MISLRYAAAIALSAVALCGPAVAAPTDAPKNGDVVACNVSTLMASAYFIQCGVFAGTLVASEAGGYSGMLVCRFIGQADCQDVVQAVIDAGAGPLKGHTSANCTLGDARDIVARFHCTL